MAAIGGMPELEVTDLGMDGAPAEGAGGAGLKPDSGESSPTDKQPRDPETGRFVKIDDEDVEIEHVKAWREKAQSYEGSQDFIQIGQSIATALQRGPEGLAAIRRFISAYEEQSGIAPEPEIPAVEVPELRLSGDYDQDMEAAMKAITGLAKGMAEMQTALGKYSRQHKQSIEGLRSSLSEYQSVTARAASAYESASKVNADLKAMGFKLQVQPDQIVAAMEKTGYSDPTDAVIKAYRSQLQSTGAAAPQKPKPQMIDGEPDRAIDLKGLSPSAAAAAAEEAGLDKTWVPPWDRK